MGFANSIIGGAAALVRAAIKSPNFMHGSAGWSINKDGSAEFNNLVIRGTFDGTDFIINASGAFFYSGAPASGNLIASIASVNGTDGFGNPYIAGITSYSGSTTWASLGGAVLNLQIGGEAQAAQVGAGGAGQSFISSGIVTGLDIGATVIVASQAGSGAGQSEITLSAALVQALNAMTVDGNLTVIGSLILTVPLAVSGTSATAGLADGTIHGTSGGASAGTPHTHGPGSFAVANGQHSHGAGSYQA